jgi:(4S)-4-hydroxy-5-phosphonooxypentane-2,3-dione isomerase
MYVVCVTVWVKPGSEAEFIEKTRVNHIGTRQEIGNLRFDVLQRVDDPTQFFLYEAYQTAEDFTAHQQTPHYVAWKDGVADLMAQKRQGIKHQSLFPDEFGW